MVCVDFYRYLKSINFQRNPTAPLESLRETAFLMEFFFKKNDFPIDFLEIKFWPKFPFETELGSTSSTQLQGNAGLASVTTFPNDIPPKRSENTSKSKGEVEVPSLPPPEVRKKLPAPTMLLNDQEVKTLIDWGSNTNVINPLPITYSFRDKQHLSEPRYKLP